MFSTNPTYNSAAWDNVYEASRQWMEQLHAAVLGSTPPGQFGYPRLLDVQIEQVQQWMTNIETQLKSLDADEQVTGQYDWTSVSGQFFFLPLSPAGIRQVQKHGCRAYAEMLAGYLVLLKEARKRLENMGPSASRREQGLHEKITLSRP